MDLTALQSAVAELTSEVSVVVAQPAPVGVDDQAAVDAVTNEVEGLIAELKSASAAPAAPDPAPAAPAVPDSGSTSSSGPAGFPAAPGS